MIVLPRWHCKVERGVRYSFSGLEILLGEGGDVELGARTSEHIIVFAFDPLSLNSLSLICVVHSIIHIVISYCLCCALHLSYYYISIICLTCVCVPHLYLTTRASYSTSTLIQRNQEELSRALHREFGFTRWLH